MKTEEELQKRLCDLEEEARSGQQVMSEERIELGARISELELMLDKSCEATTMFIDETAPDGVIEQEEAHKLPVILLANANIVRKVVLCANKRIRTAIEESEESEDNIEGFMKFIELFMHGTDREEIFRTLHMSSTLADKLTNIKELNW